jgi:hypothetical protein
MTRPGRMSRDRRTALGVAPSGRSPIRRQRVNSPWVAQTNSRPLLARSRDSRATRNDLRASRVLSPSSLGCLLVQASPPHHRCAKPSSERRSPFRFVHHHRPRLIERCRRFSSSQAPRRSPRQRTNSSPRKTSLAPNIRRSSRTRRAWSGDSIGRRKGTRSRDSTTRLYSTVSLGPFPE